MIAAADRRLERVLGGRPRRKGGLYPLTCSECGGRFSSTRGDAETCSPRCRKRRQRQQEALSRISLASTTDVAEIVSGGVTGAGTNHGRATVESRQLDQREFDELSWRLTLTNSRCHYPGCAEPRKGMVLRRRRPGEVLFCERHFG